MYVFFKAIFPIWFHWVSKFKKKIENLILQDVDKQAKERESTARELSFEWSHIRVSSTDLKVETPCTV